MTNTTTNEKTATFADDLREMIAAWNQIVSTARREFPNASEAELQKICSDAMNHAIGL